MPRTSIHARIWTESAVLRSCGSGFGIITKSSTSYSALAQVKGRWFGVKRDPAKQQPVLVTMDRLEGGRKETVLVDPNAMDAKSLVSIDWYRVSPNGKLAAVSLSTAGSESGEEFRQCRLLLHPLSARRGAAAGGPKLLSADLLSQTVNAGGARLLLDRQGCSAYRGVSAGVSRRRASARLDATGELIF